LNLRAKLSNFDHFFELLNLRIIHGKNDFAEESKILLDLKIILLDHQDNFVGTLKIMLQKVLIF